MEFWRVLLHNILVRQPNPSYCIKYRFSEKRPDWIVWSPSRT